MAYVVGSGRSGTSTIAGILKLHGVHVPLPEVAADETNPKGFGEPQWAVDFHDRLLGRANVAVSDGRPQAWAATDEIGRRPNPSREAEAWLGTHFDVAAELVVKDPRLTWFVPLWERAARANDATPGVITMLRPPAEVFASKQQNYNADMDATHGIVGWLNLLLGTEERTRDLPRVFVRYADLLADWRGPLAIVGSTLGLASVTQAGPEAAAAVDDFVDPSLRRSQRSLDELNLAPDVHALTADTWAAFDGLANRDDADARAHLDDLRGRYAALYSSAERITGWSTQASRREGARAARRELRGG